MEHNKKETAHEVPVQEQLNVQELTKEVAKELVKNLEKTAHDTL